MPGANVSKIMLPEMKDLKIYVKLLYFVKLFEWVWLTDINALLIDRLQISKNIKEISKILEFFQGIP